MKIYVKTLDNHDSRVIFDLLKLFYSKAEIVSAEYEAELVIEIKKHFINNLFVIEVFISNDSHHNKYILETELSNFKEEERPNQTKRLIKLAVYRLLIQFTGRKPTSWGILTGIRPTKIVHRYLDQGWSGEETIVKLQQDYAVELDKATLIVKVALLQRDYLLSRNEASRIVSIYISIPFCPTRCHYCSFPAFSLGQWGHLIEHYIEALKEEIVTVAEMLRQQGLAVQTIYIGGGTPTSLSAEQLAQLLSHIKQNLYTNTLVEFTVEAGRPDTITEEKLRVMSNYGVNRISINPQTMCEETLRKIGREHTPKQIIETFQLAKKFSFDCINMDLIMGLPDENIKTLTQTLNNIEELDPDNLTLHTLAIKRAAVFNQEQIKVDSCDEIEKMLDQALQWSLNHGYIPYYLYRQKQMVGNLENIGVAKKDKICLYNIQVIEERQSIIGLGVGASSKIVNSQDWTLENFYNPKDVVFYIDRISEIKQKKVDKILAIR